MARNRIISPEFWNKIQIAECSRDARLLYIGMCNFADDAGILPANCRALKIQIFPGDDDVKAADIDTWIAELTAQGLIYQYEAENAQYWILTQWKVEQRIEKPSYKYPKPPQNDQKPKFDDHSTTVRRPFDDRSTQNRIEENRIEEREKGIPPSPDQSSNDLLPTQTNTASTPTPPGEQEPAAQAATTFDEAYQQILQFVDPNDGAELRRITELATYTGDARAELRKFVSHYIDDERNGPKLRRNPVTFFRNKFVSWLERAKNEFKPKANTNGNRFSNAPADGSPPAYTPPLGQRPKTWSIGWEAAKKACIERFGQRAQDIPNSAYQTIALQSDSPEQFWRIVSTKFTPQPALNET